MKTTFTVLVVLHFCLLINAQTIFQHGYGNNRIGINRENQAVLNDGDGISPAKYHL